jgi:hypothetical protein
MRRPLIYEIHVRCWLAEWSARLRRPARLPDVPEEELDLWRQLGFTHVWLMGIWTSGPRAREVFRQHRDTPRHLQAVLPGWVEEDVVGSAYAIAAYQIPSSLGGESGLAAFRRRLQAHGLGLILDYVPNHLGLDHPWVREHPEWFVQGPPGGEGFFECQTPSGPRWLAHGRDPWFPPWADTVQWDIRRADARLALLEQLRSVASQCDGVRCDMSMLLLRDVFTRTWEKCPSTGPEDVAEFWAEVREALPRGTPLLLAEAYWDREEELQEMGLDFTYNKRVLDYAVQRDGPGLQRFLLGKTDGYLSRSLHFLENHDEPRAAGWLRPEEQRAAAYLLLGLPGACLLHEGQLSGARIRASVHLRRRADEPTDPVVAELYHGLLRQLRSTHVGCGAARVIQPEPGEGSDAVAAGMILVQWTGADRQSGFDLVLANLSPHPGRCQVRLAPPAAGRHWHIRAVSQGRTAEAQWGGGILHLTVQAQAAEVWSFTRGD